LGSAPRFNSISTHAASLKSVASISAGTPSSSLTLGLAPSSISFDTDAVSPVWIA